MGQYEHRSNWERPVGAVIFSESAMAAKLMYVFTRVEDDKLAEDPDHPGCDFGGSADDWDSFVSPLRKEHGNIISNWILLVRRFRP